MIPPPTIGVTGASGFVGTALTRYLTERGHPVIAVTRGTVPEIPGAMVCRISDLGDAAGLRLALRSVDVVMHLAARVHVMHDHHADPLAAFRAVNVEGTRTVYRAAQQAGVKRFVFLSSIKAMGEGSVAPYRETDPPRPVDPYGMSKLEAELVLAEERARGGVEFTVLRSPLVYGPGVGGNFRRLLRLAALSVQVPLPLGNIPNQRSLLSISNLVSALEAVALHPAAADQTFLLSDTEDLSTSDLISRIAEGIGGPARLFACPTAFARVVAGLVGLKAEAERLLGSLVVDSSRIGQLLGWQPPERVTDGLAATGAWWRRESMARSSQ